MNSKFDQTWIGEEDGSPSRMNANASLSQGYSESEMLVQFAILVSFRETRLCSCLKVGGVELFHMADVLRGK